MAVTEARWAKIKHKSAPFICRYECWCSKKGCATDSKGRARGLTKSQLVAQGSLAAASYLKHLGGSNSNMVLKMKESK